MEHKYTVLATKTVQWTGTKGNKIEIIIDLVQDEQRYAGAVCRTNVFMREYATVDGERVNGWLESAADLKISVPGVDYVFGRKIAMSSECVELVKAAQTLVQSHPAWVAKKAAEARGLQAEKEYHDHNARVESMMTLGGKTY